MDERLYISNKEFESDLVICKTKPLDIKTAWQAQRLASTLPLTYSAAIYISLLLYLRLYFIKIRTNILNFVSFSSCSVGFRITPLYTFRVPC